MELSFLSLKQKDVISVGEGKNLGKVCDITVSYPECNWLGITVTGSRGFKLTNRGEMFIPVNLIVSIGEDAILVKSENPPPCPPPPCPPPKGKCPPNSPPPRPHSNNSNNFSGKGPDRRDYGEYE